MSTELRQPLADDENKGLINTPPDSGHHHHINGASKQSAPLQYETNSRSSVFAALIFAGFAVLLISLYFIGKWAASTTTPNNELDFQNQVSPERIREHLEYYTNASHIAGSIRDYETALYTAKMMREYGIEAEIEEYEVLLNYPINRTVQIISPPNLLFTARMEEVVGNEFAVDPTSGLSGVETFLGWSKSGDVSAPLVYVNYGQLEDFEAVTKLGIQINGTIVLVRYGQIFRGNKAQLAEQYGAKACIIYSDPEDDGFVKGTPYPDGPWRPATGVQRGSIWNGNGDPLTPGYPSVPGAPRLTLDQAYANDDTTYYTPLPGIPVVPLSWNDTAPLLASLTGAIVSKAWRGGIPNITYRYGGFGNSSIVRVQVAGNFTTMKIWNVIGKITGTVEPDRIILLGNHRDAWVFGGADPNSGTASLLEVAHGLGKLLKSGWTPRRSIWLCSWDAEEYALIGSTEFCENHEKQLMNQAVVYMNVDIAVTGGLAVSLQGMPSLSQVMRDVTATIDTPRPPNGTWGEEHWPSTLYGMWQEAYTGPGAPVLDASQMGTGSDYGAFVEHLGIPSLDLMYVGNGSYDGVYHSQFDSFYWMTHFGDPHFIYHAAIAKLWGTLDIRISDTALLPFQFTDYATALNNALIALKGFSNSSGMELRFDSMEKSIDYVKSQATFIDAFTVSYTATGPSDLSLRQLNDVLMLAERGFLFLQGVKGREWYRHMVWVSGLFNGYGAIPFASVSDAISANDPERAQQQIDLISVVLGQMGDMISVPALP